MVDDRKVSGRRAGRARCFVGGMLLAALAMPARAEEDVLGQMDRQVAAIVKRVGPSVVSVRVGPRQAGGSAAPRGGKGRAGIGFSLAPGDPAASLFGESRDGAGAMATPVIGYEPSRLAMLGGPAMALFQSTRVGTGFVIDGDGIILTTADVVGNSDQVVVKLAEGRELDGKVLGADSVTGVAVVKVEGAKLPALRLAEKEDVEPGQWAIIVGNQLDMTHTVWVGTVARTDVVFPSPRPQGRLLQIHTPVGAGASGAPVLNAKGDVIGVVVATSNPALLRLGDADPAGANELQLKMAMEGLKNKVGKNDPKRQRQVERITEAAARIAQRAADRARQLSERITDRAKQLGEKTAERAQALRNQYEQDVRRAVEERNRSDEERERLDGDLERLGEQLERQLDQLGEELDRQLERELKPLEEDLDRQLEQDLKPLEDELEKLGEVLPSAHGVRAIALDLGPEVARVVASAHQIAETAVAAALAGVRGMPDLSAPPATAVPPAAPAPPGIRFWSGRTPGQGASTFAIPAATAHSVVVQIREHGRVSHAYLGVRLETLKPEERERLKAPQEARVRVADIFPGSPAQEAGLQKDDLVLEFQGKKLEEATDLTDLMARARAGERVSLVIWRGGERRTVQATLRERPQQAFAFAFPQPMVITPQPMPQPRVPNAPRLRVEPPRASVRSFVRVLPSGHVAASAVGPGRDARVTLEAQDAELEAVLRELSRATQLQLRAEGDAARRRVTLKVEGVSVDDLVESLTRLYHLRSERQGDRITFRPR